MHFLILLVLVVLVVAHEDTPPPLPDTAPIRFALDELDRVAIVHNRDFRPKYIECQNLMADYYDGLIRGSHTVGDEHIKTLDQSRLIGRLKICASRLKEYNEDLQDKLEDFADAVGDIE